MSSFRAKAMRAVTSAWFRSVNAEKADVHRMRSVWHTLANTLWTASGVDVRRTGFAGMRAEWLTPQAPARRKVMLYLHGGADVFDTIRDATAESGASIRRLDAGAATLEELFLAKGRTT